MAGKLVKLAKACLPRPRAEQPFGRGNDSHSGDPGCRPGGYRVPRDRRADTTCNEPHVPGAASQVPGEPVPADRSRRGGHHHVIVNIVGGYCSASSAWRFEQGGDFSDGFGTWADVPHRGARVAVPGLGHDQLQRDALLATGREQCSHHAEYLSRSGAPGGYSRVGDYGHGSPRPWSRARPGASTGLWLRRVPATSAAWRRVGGRRTSSSTNTSILLSSHVRLGTWQVCHPPAAQHGHPNGR